MTEQNEELQNIDEEDIISGADDGTQDAGTKTPEDTSADPYKAIAEQQQKTIDALMARTESLTSQINQLISSGIQINDGTSGKEPDTGAQDNGNGLPEDYVTLSDLGKEFGKR